MSEIPKEVLERAEEEAIKFDPKDSVGDQRHSFESGYALGYSSRDEEVKELREALEFYARDRILVARLSKSLMGISEWFQQHPAREVLEKWKEK